MNLLLATAMLWVISLSFNKSSCVHECWLMAQLEVEFDNIVSPKVFISYLLTCSLKFQNSNEIMRSLSYCLHTLLTPNKI